jgi:hypothetical protein
VSRLTLRRAGRANIDPMRKSPTGRRTSRSYDRRLSRPRRRAFARHEFEQNDRRSASDGEQFVEILCGVAVAAARPPSCALATLTATARPCQKREVGESLHLNRTSSGESRLIWRVSVQRTGWVFCPICSLVMLANAIGLGLISDDEDVGFVYQPCERR